MSVEENKKVARMYHDLNPADVEKILTADFVGRGGNAFTWNRDSHKEFTSTIQGQIKDDVHQQIAEGDLMATRFTRSGTYEGKPVKWDMMQFKRFVDGKIAEVWEITGLEELPK